MQTLVEISRLRGYLHSQRDAIQKNKHKPIKKICNMCSPHPSPFSLSLSRSILACLPLSFSLSVFLSSFLTPSFSTSLSFYLHLSLSLSTPVSLPIFSFVLKELLICLIKHGGGDGFDKHYIACERHHLSLNILTQISLTRPCVANSRSKHDEFRYQHFPTCMFW